MLDIVPLEIIDLVCEYLENPDKTNLYFCTATLYYAYKYKVEEIKRFTLIATDRLIGLIKILGINLRFNCIDEFLFGSANFYLEYKSSEGIVDISRNQEGNITINRPDEKYILYDLDKDKTMSTTILCSPLIKDKLAYGLYHRWLTWTSTSVPSGYLFPIYRSYTPNSIIDLLHSIVVPYISDSYDIETVHEDTTSIRRKLGRAMRIDSHNMAANTFILRKPGTYQHNYTKLSSARHPKVNKLPRGKYKKTYR